jgi:hypothetical protein
MTPYRDGPVSPTDGTLDAVLGAAQGVLILTRTTCHACGSYQAEVAALAAQGRLDGLAVGTLVLDRPGASRFKRDNPWLAGLRYLPFTALYRRGERIDAFAASKGAYLLERIEAAFGRTWKPAGGSPPASAS